MAIKRVAIRHPFENLEPDDGVHPTIPYTMPSDWNAEEYLVDVGADSGDVMTWHPGSSSKAAFRKITSPGGNISVTVTDEQIRLDTAVTPTSGSGTVGKLAKWTAATILGDSIVTEGSNTILVKPAVNSAETFAVKKLNDFKMLSVDTSGDSIYLSNEVFGSVIEIDTTIFRIKSFDLAKTVLTLNVSSPATTTLGDVLLLDAEAATVATTLFRVRKLPTTEYFRVDTTGIRLGTKMTLYNNAAPVTGALLIGNATGGTFDANRLTAGSGVTIDDTSSPGNITISATGTLSGSGTSGKLAKWTGATALGDSIVTEAAGPATLTIAGAVGIGRTPLSTAGLHIQTEANTFIIHDRYTPDGLESGIIFRKARGSAAAPASVADTDVLGQMGFNAYGTGFNYKGGIAWFVNGTVSGDNIPTAVTISSYDAAAANVIERVRITGKGQFCVVKSTGNTIGQATPLFSYVQLSIGGTNDQTGLGFNAEGLGVFSTLKVDGGAGLVVPGIVSHITWERPASGSVSVVAGIYAETPEVTGGGSGTAAIAATYYAPTAPTFGVQNYAMYLVQGSVRVGDPIVPHAFGALLNTAIGYRFHTTAPASNGDGATVAMSVTGTLTTTSNGEIMAGIFPGYTANLTFATGTSTGLSASMLYLDGARMAKTGTGTITNAATVRIVTEPNAISTNQYALWVSSGRVLFSDAQKHSIGGAWKTYSGITIRGSVAGDATNGVLFGTLFEPSMAPSSGDIVALFGTFNGASITKTGTNPVAAGLYMAPPTLTGGGTATIGATVYISDETSGATTNYALYVAAGKVFFPASSVGIGVTPSYSLHLGGSVTTDRAMHLGTSVTPGLNTSGYGIVINPTLVEHSSGEHPILAGIQLEAPTITAGAATVARAYTLHIVAAPTVTVTTAKEAFRVDAGLSTFGGIVSVSGGSGNLGSDNVGMELRGTTTPSIIAYNRSASNYLPMLYDSSRHVFTLSGGADPTDAAVVYVGAFTGPSNGWGAEYATTVTLPANGIGATLLISGTIVEAGSGNHSILAQMYLNGLAVTGGAATVTNTATIYVADAASATVSGANYALWVDAGVSRLDGVLVMESTYVQWQNSGSALAFMGRASDLITSGNATHLAIRAETALVLGIGTTAKVTLDSSGNLTLVGSIISNLTIAKTTPIIDINGTGVTSAFLQYTTNSSARWGVGVASGGTDLLFQSGGPGGTTRFTIGSDGAVTIADGTTAGILNAGVLQASGPVWLNIDSDNNTTGAYFVVGKDRASASGGTDLLTIFEDGTVLVNVGPLKFGTFTSDAGATTHTGYITVKDSGGTDRKIAVVS